jgi:hypothetical protein
MMGYAVNVIIRESVVLQHKKDTIIFFNCFLNSLLK